MRARPLALFVAGLLLTTSLIGLPATPAAAGPYGGCASVNTFRLLFMTGDDDLRHNSTVYVTVNTSAGNYLLQPVVGGYPAGSYETVNLPFADPDRTVDSCSIVGVTLRLVSHPGPFETADNWDLGAFDLHARRTSGPGFRYYLYATGAPLKRFTGSDPYWTGTG